MEQCSTSVQRRARPASWRCVPDGARAVRRQAAHSFSRSIVPPPSLQIDTSSKKYVNELSLFNGLVAILLSADYEASSDDSLRVAFRTLELRLLGVSLPPFRFPAGTERTWLLKYTDGDTRVVRAGVDGGRSTAREIGLLSKQEGEAADSYLFFLTKAPASARGSGVRAAGAREKAKAELLELCGGSERGATSDQVRGAHSGAQLARHAARTARSVWLLSGEHRLVE